MPVYSRASTYCLHSLYNSPERKKAQALFFLPKKLGTVTSIPQQAKDYTCSDMQLASKFFRLLVHLRSSSRKGKDEGNEVAERLPRYRARVIVRDPIGRDDDS